MCQSYCRRCYLWCHGVKNEALIHSHNVNTSNLWRWSWNVGMLSSLMPSAKSTQRETKESSIVFVPFLNYNLKIWARRFQSIHKFAYLGRITLFGRWFGRLHRQVLAELDFLDEAVVTCRAAMTLTEFCLLGAVDLRVEMRVWHARRWCDYQRLERCHLRLEDIDLKIARLFYVSPNKNYMNMQWFNKIKNINKMKNGLII